MLFRRTIRRLAVSPYAIFLKQTAKGFPIGKGGIAARGRAIAAAYKNLSPKGMQRLQYLAKNAKTPKRKVKKARKPNVYAKFVKANAKKVAKLPAKKRFAALGKLWRAAKRK